MTTSDFTLSNIYYSKRLSNFINNLLLGVLALGILLIAYNYGRLALSIPGYIFLTKPGFWLKLILLFTVVAFVSYDVIAYKIHLYVQEQKNIKQLNTDINWIKSIYLFLVDLFQVCIAAWLLSTIAVSEIGVVDIMDIAYDFESRTYDMSKVESIIDQVIAINVKLYFHLLIFYALWHLTVMIWYFIEGSESRKSKRFHGIRAGVNLLVFLIILLLEDKIGFRNGSILKLILDIFMVLYFILNVATIYKNWLVSFLKEDLKYHVRNGTDEEGENMFEE